MLIRKIPESLWITPKSCATYCYFHNSPTFTDNLQIFLLNWSHPLIIKPINIFMKTSTWRDGFQIIRDNDTCLFGIEFDAPFPHYQITRLHWSPPTLCSSIASCLPQLQREHLGSKKGTFHNWDSHQHSLYLSQRLRALVHFLLSHRPSLITFKLRPDRNSTLPLRSRTS